MTALEIDKRISLGNVLVICGMIVSMSMGWANLSSQNSKLTADVEAAGTMGAGKRGANPGACFDPRPRAGERLPSS